MSASPERLSSRVIETLATAEPPFVSVVSGWEYGLKRQRNPVDFKESFATLLQDFEFRGLDLSFDLHRYAEDLPAVHKDPFDRMLVAQAIGFDLVLVTKDAVMRRYPVETLW